MIETIALDEGWTSTAQAEHESLEQLSKLGLRLLLACTHFIPARDTHPPRVAVTAQVTTLGNDPIAAAATTACCPDPDLAFALAAQLSRRSGRAFVFTGARSIERVVSVATLLSSTAVDDVLTLGGGSPPGSARIDTQHHLRPEFRAGRLVLRVRPAVGIDLVPFEQPHPTPCCADHT